MGSRSFLLSCVLGTAFLCSLAATPLALGADVQHKKACATAFQRPDDSVWDALKTWELRGLFRESFLQMVQDLKDWAQRMAGLGVTNPRAAIFLQVPLSQTEALHSLGQAEGVKVQSHPLERGSVYLEIFGTVEAIAHTLRSWKESISLLKNQEIGFAASFLWFHSMGESLHEFYEEAKLPFEPQRTFLPSSDLLDCLIRDGVNGNQKISKIYDIVLRPVITASKSVAQQMVHEVLTENQLAFDLISARKTFRSRGTRPYSFDRIYSVTLRGTASEVVKLLQTRKSSHVFGDPEIELRRPLLSYFKSTP